MKYGAKGRPVERPGWADMQLAALDMEIGQNAPIDVDRDGQDDDQGHDNTQEGNNGDNGAAAGPLPKRKSHAGSGAKCWVWTANSQVRPRLNEFIQYICSQQERAPETGRLHYQGYIEMKQRCTLNTMKKKFDKEAHLEIRRGSREQAINYTKKPESAIADTWLEEGVLTSGTAVDQMETMTTAILGGKKHDDVAQEWPEMIIRYAKGVRSLIAATQKSPKWRNVLCEAVWGDPGVGKTRIIYEKHDGDVYFKDNTPWWDGYNGEDVVLFDDFYGGHKINDMLRWMDGYKLQLQVKGDFVQAFYTRVYFTSNEPPCNWYKNVPLQVRNAFFRRLKNENCWHAEFQEGDERPKMSIAGGIGVLPIARLPGGLVNRENTPPRADGNHN